MLNPPNNATRFNDPGSLRGPVMANVVCAECVQSEQLKRNQAGSCRLDGRFFFVAAKGAGLLEFGQACGLRGLVNSNAS